MVKAWSKETRYLMLIIILLVVIGIFVYFREIFPPIGIAAILAYVMHPAVDFLTRKTRLTRRTAVIIVYFVSLLLLAAIPAVLTPVVINQLQVIELDLVGLVEYYSNFLTTPVYVLDSVFYPGDFLPELPQISTDLVTPLVENALRLLGAATLNVVWVMVILVTTYYLLQDWHHFQAWLVRLLPEEYQPDVERLFHELAQVWSDYLRSQLAFMFIVGLLDSLVWLAVGLPGAIILGFFTGLTSFVHEIGAVISGVFSVLAAFIGGSTYLRMSNFWFAVLVLILYMVLTAAKNIWIRPIIVGRGVHMHAGIVFVLVIAALMFHGALAAFLVVPILVSLMVVGGYLRRRVLGLPPFPDEEVEVTSDG
jgi:predicted PurR-regulated permease PerM